MLFCAQVIALVRYCVCYSTCAHWAVSHAYLHARRPKTCKPSAHQQLLFYIILLYKSNKMYL